MYLADVLISDEKFKLNGHVYERHGRKDYDGLVTCACCGYSRTVKAEIWNAMLEQCKKQIALREM